MISLKRYGIEFEGPVEEAMRSSVPEARLRFICGKALWEVAGRLLEDGVSVDAGTYGLMKSCAVFRRTGPDELLKVETVYEKSPKYENGNLMAEICLQILAKQELTLLGMGHVIADIKDIIRRPGKPITFTMQQFEHVLDLHKAIQMVGGDLRGPAFDIWFLPLLIQVILIVGLLEERIGLNHRDLKGDNLLISMKTKQQQRIVSLAGRAWQFTFTNEIYVVDFGFSCRGTVSGGPASISAGPFFGLRDVCPKEGRDVYVILCYLYSLPQFRVNASGRLLGLVRELLHSAKVLEHLETYGMERTEYIYLLLNKSDFKSERCCPGHILGCLAEKWPQLIFAI
jgi:serine/threonine protein kinase